MIITTFFDKPVHKFFQNFEIYIVVHGTTRASGFSELYFWTELLIELSNQFLAGNTHIAHLVDISNESFLIAPFCSLLCLKPRFPYFAGSSYISWRFATFLRHN